MSSVCVAHGKRQTDPFANTVCRMSYAGAMSTCKIFVHSVASVPEPKEVPHEWEFSKYSAELHLQRGLVAPDPRLTSSAETASLVFVAANLSLWCAAGRAYGARRLLRRILDDPLVQRPAPPKVLVVSNTECWQQMLHGVCPAALLTDHTCLSP